MLSPTRLEKVWIHCVSTKGHLATQQIDAGAPSSDGRTDGLAEELKVALYSHGMESEQLNIEAPVGMGVLIVPSITPALCDWVAALSRQGLNRVLVLVADAAQVDHEYAWRVLHAGASDVLFWKELPDPIDIIVARLRRWQEVDQLLASPLVRQKLIGQCPVWLTALRQIVEAARYTDNPILLTGETGTGKELAAHLIHALSQRSQRDLVVLDCTTIVPDLSGSELFGHERGAFTGSVNARDGAFALANRGTLFLDEIGELSLGLQVQLLRSLQEHTYKRVGSNTWRDTDFRLVCATNRDLLAEEADGRFRRDLYYRIASWTFKLPALSERPADILPLAHHFIQQARPNQAKLELDERVQEYLLTREYPGNVRDLRNLILRMVARHVGNGPITIGDVPSNERRQAHPSSGHRCNAAIENAVRCAIAYGVGLKDIRRMVDEMAIRVAVEEEDGNLQRAARILGVTDRALQIRRAEQRQRIQSPVALPYDPAHADSAPWPGVQGLNA